MSSTFARNLPGDILDNVASLINIPVRRGRIYPERPITLQPFGAQSLNDHETGDCKLFPSQLLSYRGDNSCLKVRFRSAFFE